jgi:hypothetical protein
MKLSELALEEINGVVAFIASLLFLRLVRMVSPQNRAVYVVLGVPPWRRLMTKDMYQKVAFQVF